MNKDYLALIFISFISVLLLLVFVKKTQIKKAFFALLVAQLFSWPISLIFVYFGLINIPVRIFPHATDNSFIYAFLFQPSVFAVYYLHYPKQARLWLRLLYTAVILSIPLSTQILAHLYTNIFQFTTKWTLIVSFLLVFAIYNVARMYIDWFFKKSFSTMED